MSLVGAIAGWIGRHLLLFVLLVAAMVLYAQVRPAPGSTAALEASVAALDGADAELRAYVSGLEGRAVTALDTGQRNSTRAIDTRLGELRRQRVEIEGKERSMFDRLSAPRAAIVAEAKQRIDLALIDQEIGFLETLREAVSLDGLIARNRARIRALDKAISDDESRIQALPSGWSPNRYVREGMTVRDLKTVYQERQAANRAARGTAVAAMDAQLTARQRLGDIRQMATPAVALEALEMPLAEVSAAARLQRERLEATIEGQARKWYDRLRIGDFLWPAFWALLAIVLAPFAVRTLFYWVLAPVASLRRPITLLEPGASIPVPVDRSSVSKAISLMPGEELLVKQGYLQSPSDSGSKATQWLLDARFPFTSLATGLYFLTRIRNEAGLAGSAGRHEHTVSAVRDPFAEVGLLALPAGAACVLQPRAIAGVVQAIDAPMRITSHWRLGTLNAWLTWQLRFLVFHGPATVILQGGRGVRMETVETGRSIGQHQLIGFSAGLSYSTRRTETFLPYLFGMEPLLKDRIATGSGLLIAEEAPMASRRTGVARGFEGAMDALLKVFGI